MVSKTNNFTLYFSNETTAPICNVMSDNQVNKISNDSGINFKLFPNPAVNETIFVSANDEKIVYVKVYDLQGKLLIGKQDNSTLLKINISEIPPGTYVIEITGTKSKKRSLFVKK
ncbi:T9SS type A sorting domain-containing protein [Cellulophaga omnivescoria]|uniref:T9SS type A sorting domain-containing protein n=1 Tax=Cellulophaga omnivescoria TaxID=1888890 RepID=UPI000987AB94|nr:T9SS type A sorting domain-containing protein [Cellulophaga omnivescoria]WBU91018.1 T9SS type A sorting domain-containing protein [Cellulophaga omnivescoria]WKB83111.1 T9SS type A sorting domain-containing protein [Cellulophaga lytica]